MDKTTMQILTAELEHVKEILERIEKTIKESRTVFNISEEDVWAIAEKEGMKIPEEKKEDVIYTVKKYLESYCFDEAYNIWDAIKDAIKEALNDNKR